MDYFYFFDGGGFASRVLKKSSVKIFDSTCCGAPLICLSVGLERLGSGFKKRIEKDSLLRVGLDGDRALFQVREIGRIVVGTLEKEVLCIVIEIARFHAKIAHIQIWVSAAVGSVAHKLAIVE